MTLNWFISDCFPRSLASIEASARGKHLEMKLYYRDRVPIIHQVAIKWQSDTLLVKLQSICINLYEMESIGFSLVRVAFQWQSGSALDGSRFNGSSESGQNRGF